MNKDQDSSDADKLRLRTPKGEVVFVAAENVLLAKSFDHWVKVLVKDGKKFVWFESHITLHDFLLLKAAAHLERRSKFYAVNKSRVTLYVRKNRTLVFDHVFTVELEHELPAYFL